MRTDPRKIVTTYTTPKGVRPTLRNGRSRTLEGAIRHAIRHVIQNRATGAEIYDGFGNFLAEIDRTRPNRITIRTR